MTTPSWVNHWRDLADVAGFTLLSEGAGSLTHGRDGDEREVPGLLG
ncbi:MAG: hypothetical protein ACR2HN_03770 [Tepidiformaceae bacterium]